MKLPKNKKKDACWVCGELTTDTCSACREAGIDIFFCSREHQKLVWPVHKLVCGPGKANPFLWPPLTPEEKDDMLAHLHDSFPMPRTEGGTAQMSLADTLGEVYNDGTLSVREASRKAVVDAAEDDDGDPAFQPFINNIRLANYLRIMHSKRAPLTHPVTLAYNRASHTLALGFSHDLASTPATSAWYSALHHRSLLFFYISIRQNRIPTSEPASKELMAYFSHSFKQLLFLIRDEVSKTHPAEAKKLAETFRPGS